jgi:hypothetical protein
MQILTLEFSNTFIMCFCSFIFMCNTLIMCYNFLSIYAIPSSSTWEEGSRHQVHVAMNAHVLNNLLAWFYHNEQKVIAKAKKHTNLEWDRFQVDLQYTPNIPNPAFVKLICSHIF